MKQDYILQNFLQNLSKFLSYKFKDLKIKWLQILLLKFTDT